MVEIVNEEDNKYTFTILPKEIYKVHNHESYTQSHKIGFYIFFMKVPCGIDAKRIIQYVKIVDVDGHAIIDNNNGTPIPIQITTELIANALKVSGGGEMVR